MSQFEKTISYFRESSEKDWAIAQRLFISKDYAYALFFCHLALEKLLKSIVVATTDKAAPYIHDLAKLATIVGMALDEETEKSLEEITDFNIATRYDDEKIGFYKKCTKPYAEKYMEITRTLITWLNENYPQK